MVISCLEKNNDNVKPLTISLPEYIKSRYRQSSKRLLSAIFYDGTGFGGFRSIAKVGVRKCRANNFRRWIFNLIFAPIFATKTRPHVASNKQPVSEGSRQRVQFPSKRSAPEATAIRAGTSGRGCSATTTSNH